MKTKKLNNILALNFIICTLLVPNANAAGLWGGDATVSLPTVLGLFSGEGDYLKSDGTKGNPSGSGDLVSTYNLSDLTDLSAARQNLGLEIGVDVMPNLSCQEDGQVPTWDANTSSFICDSAVFVETDSTAMAAINAMGTAINYDVGSAIGELPILVDDGDSNPSLAISAIDLPSVSSISINGTVIDADANGKIDAGFLDASGSGASSLAELSDWPTDVTATEVGYLDGVTSAIQTQIEGKQATITEAGTLPVTASVSNISPSASTLAAYIQAIDDKLGELDGVLASIGYPSLTIDQTSPQAITEDSLELTGTYSDDGTVTDLTYSLNSGTPVDITPLSSPWSTTITGFDSGVNTVAVTVIDDTALSRTKNITVNYTPDETAPTLLSAELLYDGTGLTNYIEYTYDENVTANSTSDLCGYVVTMSTAGLLTQTYSTGDGFDTVRCDVSQSVLSTDTLSAGSYTQGTIQDGNANLLANIASLSGVFTNSSTLEPEACSVDNDSVLFYENDNNLDTTVSSTTWVKQTITPANGATLTAAAIYIKDTGADVGNAKVELYTGTMTLLATSSIPATSIPATYGARIEFDFVTPYISDGSMIRMIVHGDSGGTFAIGVDQYGAYSGGSLARSTDSGVTWPESWTAYDLPFQVFGCAP